MNEIDKAYIERVARIGSRIPERRELYIQNLVATGYKRREDALKYLDTDYSIIPSKAEYTGCILNDDEFKQVRDWMIKHFTECDHMAALGETPANFYIKNMMSSVGPMFTVGCTVCDAKQFIISDW